MITLTIFQELQMLFVPFFHTDKADIGRKLTV